MDYTIVVAASAAEPAPFLYIAPYTGCALGEYFRDNKKHALCIYDDLSKHAASYREMQAFAMFASDLDKSTQALLNRGQRTTEILKQDQYKPLPVEQQIAVIYAATNGFLDALAVHDCRRYEKELLAWLARSQAPLLKAIAEKKDLKGELGDQLKAALTTFGSQFQATAKA